MGKRGWIAIATIVEVGAMAAAFSLRHRGPQPPPKRESAPVSKASEMSFPGRVEAVNIVNVAAPIDGTVEQVTANAGDDVFEGEALAHIKNTKLDSAAQATKADALRGQARVSDLQAAIIAARLEASRSRAEAERARGDMERAAKLYQRQQMLNEQGATPRLVFERAEKDYASLKADAASFEQLAKQAEDRIATLTAELTSAQALLERKIDEWDGAKAQLAAGDVHSPADGILLARRAEPGEVVSRAMPDLFRIAVNLSSLQVAVSPGAEALRRIRPGQTAVIEIAESPGGIAGAVREVKAGQVLVSFTSPTPLVRPGLTAQVKIRIT